MAMFTLKKKIVAVISLAVMLAFGISWLLLYGVVRNGIVRQSTLELSQQTALLAASLKDGGMERFSANVKKWEDILRGRITLIGSNGVVLADTERNPEAMENHLTRPEVKEALASGEGSSLRYSATTNMYYLYFARRVETEGRVAVLRAAYPLEFLSEVFAETRNKFILYLFVAVVLILAFGTWLARLFFRPLDRIVEFAGKIAQGEAVRFPIMAEPELQRLSSALDAMSARLRGALAELRTEREDLSRIVTALPVGVILLDEERRVRYLNDVGKRLLCVKEDIPNGVPVERILPSGDMYPLVAAALNGDEDCLTLDLPELGNRYLRICSRRTSSGVLLVISDLTEEYRLEQSRRDFIADAGHELQTPLASIRLAAEFLMEGPKRTDEDEKCLTTIIAQQERMTRLVDDLLLLSRMESEPPLHAEEEVDLCGLLSAVVEDNRSHPLAGRIRVEEEYECEAPAVVRSEDIARALNNIVENAVKYVHEKFGDEEGGRILVSIRPEKLFWSVRVEDNGPGISSETAGVLFQRFRRGDSHRARGKWGKGGYGLGLAIARKIVLDAGGDILLHPSDAGAVFEVLLPRKD